MNGLKKNEEKSTYIIYIKHEYNSVQAPLEEARRGAKSL